MRYPALLMLVATLGLLTACAPKVCETNETTWTNCVGERPFRDAKFTGSWKNNLPNGQGTLLLPNGDKYVGALEDGNLTARGTWFSADGGKYTGEWLNNSFHGRGTFFFPHGDKYDGQFAYGKMNGHGSMAYKDGSKYVGEWRDNKYHGRGTLSSLNGANFVGEFRLGNIFSGQGTLISSDGAKIVGTFSDGLPHGHITSYTADGSEQYKGWMCKGTKFDGPCPE